MDCCDYVYRCNHEHLANASDIQRLATSMGRFCSHSLYEVPAGTKSILEPIFTPASKARPPTRLSDNATSFCVKFQCNLRLSEQRKQEPGDSFCTELAQALTSNDAEVHCQYLPRQGIEREQRRCQSMKSLFVSVHRELYRASPMSTSLTVRVDVILHTAAIKVDESIGPTPIALLSKSMNGRNSL